MHEQKGSAMSSPKQKLTRLWLMIATAAILLTLTAVSIPNLLRSRIAANEASALGSIRTINTALATYSEQHPGEGYPQKLSDLSPYMDASLVSGLKSGYSFRYPPQSAGFDGVVNSFKVEAIPLSTQTGVRRFTSNETGAIHYQARSTQPEQLLDNGSTQFTQKAASHSPHMMRKATLNMIVNEPTAVGEKIRVLAQQLGGYVDSVRSEEEGAGATQTSIQIRVPVDRFEEARRKIRALAQRVKDEQDDARDVSAQAVDLESNLRNYRAEETQYLGIMRRSGTIKDTLAVSEHLADVRGRIERTQGQLNQLSHQTEMALLEISLRTEAVAHAVEVRWHPIAEIRSAFWTAASDLSIYLDFMITFLFRLPIFALWTITFVASFFGGWRLLRWTWKKFSPVNPIAEPSH